MRGKPDVIWASPDCSTYSVAAISYHRTKNKITGNLDPVTDYAKFCDKTNKHLLTLIKKFKPPCRNGAPCHERAPRGSKAGTQKIKGSVGRSVIPKRLCEHILNLCSHKSSIN